MIKKGAAIGILSGFVLGLFLKWVESFSSIKVYTLLLNIDFIPVLGDYIWPEWVEFFFHLIISVLIGIIFIILLSKTNNTFKRRMVYSFFLTFPTIFLYFPLSILAIKDVPSISNMAAFSWWSAGHLLYFISIPFFYWMLSSNIHEKRA